MKGAPGKSMVSTGSIISSSMNRKQTSRFADLTAAAKFYGMGRAQFMAMRKLGEEKGDSLPVDDPAAMPAWFERMQASGARRRQCPDSVLARACEATAAPTAPRKGAPAGKVKKIAAKSPLPAEGKGSGEPPPLRITLGPEATMASIISGQMRIYAGLSAAYEKLIEAGTQQTPQGQTLYRQIADVEARILSYQKAAADLPQDDKMTVAEVQAAAMEMARVFNILLRRELPAEFPAADHEKVMAAMDRVNERLPMMLPAVLKAAA